METTGTHLHTTLDIDQIILDLDQVACAEPSLVERSLVRLCVVVVTSRDDGSFEPSLTSLADCNVSALLVDKTVTRQSCMLSQKRIHTHRISMLGRNPPTLPVTSRLLGGMCVDAPVVSVAPHV